MKYTNLFLMSIFSFASMYILMYMMVDQLSNVYANLNQLYMAALMTAPMVIFELFFMRSMYENKRLNFLINIAACMVMIGSIIGIRKQVGITDREFLKSMIPHHAAALLMCQQSHLHDPEIKQLCHNIRTSQQAEIDFMKMKLKALEK
jgi:uncharacterized protein (DUF305 family)